MAIDAVVKGKKSFFKFISANDSGETGGHQSGILIPKPAVPVIFPESYKRGEKHDYLAKVLWNEEIETHSKFTYYGKKTRDEYRLTRFGKAFIYSERVETGSIFILIRNDEEFRDYSAYILKEESEIDNFLAAFSLSPVESGKIIETDLKPTYNLEENEFERLVLELPLVFPSTSKMSELARMLFDNLYNKKEIVLTDPDKRLLQWTDMEYRFFRYFEKHIFGNQIKRGFNDIEEFLGLANSILNRRKSRAGKSLEHQLAAIFDNHVLPYTSQAKTERKNTADFIFPSEIAYRSLPFPSDEVVFLAVKTTCKDRWRQILTEAKKAKTKYLFTLQQGISSEQLKEMESESVRLVVPKPYIVSFPSQFRKKILSLSDFIHLITEYKKNPPTLWRT